MRAKIREAEAEPEAEAQAAAGAGGRLQGARQDIRLPHPGKTNSSELHMQVLKSSLPDIPVIVPRRLSDHRGFFVEMFQAERYASIGVRHPFVQDNFSRSSHGVLRGLHLQYPNSQGKLVSVFRGRILDVAVDVRRGSPTFGKSTIVELSEDNGCQVFIPRGFAHGFVVLSDSADVFYKCDNFHSPADEIVIRWNDPELAIDWQITNPEISARDAAAPLLRDAGRLPAYAS